MALLVVSAAMPAPGYGARLMPAGLELGNGPDPYAPAVSRMVRSIAEFSRWPDETRPLTLCIVGPTDHAEDITTYQLSRGRTLSPVRIASSEATAAQCDALYIGRMSLAEQRRLADLTLGGAVLTIAENDPACRSRAMFCLLFQANSLSFRLNIDAVSRSQVRVDSRVLRMNYTGKDRG